MNQYKSISYELKENHVKFTHSGSIKKIGRVVYRNGTLYRSLPYEGGNIHKFAKKVIDELYRRAVIDEFDQLKIHNIRKITRSLKF